MKYLPLLESLVRMPGFYFTAMGSSLFIVWVSLGVRYLNRSGVCRISLVSLSDYPIPMILLGECWDDITIPGRPH